jgi:hypothetical protein
MTELKKISRAERQIDRADLKKVSNTRITADGQCRDKESRHVRVKTD